MGNDSRRPDIVPTLFGTRIASISEVMLPSECIQTPIPPSRGVISVGWSPWPPGEGEGNIVDTYHLWDRSLRAVQELTGAYRAHLVQGGDVIPDKGELFLYRKITEARFALTGGQLEHLGTPQWEYLERLSFEFEWVPSVVGWHVTPRGEEKLP